MSKAHKTQKPEFERANVRTLKVAPPQDGVLETEPAPFTDVVLICAKCAAKLGRGRKGKTELRGEVKQALKRRGLGKSVQVAETTCLDLCPKNGQTVATLRQLSAQRLGVVDGDADGETVVTLLFGPA